jgi:hypothetical protein
VGVEMQNSYAVRAIFWGGLLTGVLDLTAAFVIFGLQGARPFRILQHIASGLLGPASFAGGWNTAALGLFLHFLIAYVAAVVYYAASRELIFLTKQAVLFGMLYGAVIHVFMTFVVLPLSAIRKVPFSFSGFFVVLVVHMFFVGPPISLAVRHYSNR